MKKQLLIFIMCFSSGSIYAQIDKIVGSWSETKSIRIDTTDSGFDIIKKDWQAYAKGYKKLDPMYTDQSLIIPEEKDKLNITVTKEADFFWATNGHIFKEKIEYKLDFKEHLITIQKHRASYSYIVKYDSTIDKLFFLDHQSKNTCHEFVRKM